MNRHDVLALLEAVRAGALAPQSALERLSTMPYEDAGFARIDHHRGLRLGIPEVIYAEGKSPDQVGEIFARTAASGSDVLATRVSEAAWQAISARVPAAHFHATARAATLRQASQLTPAGTVAVLCAGTSDLPVAEEAAVTAEFLGGRSSATSMSASPVCIACSRITNRCKLRSGDRLRGHGRRAPQCGRRPRSRAGHRRAHQRRLRRSLRRPRRAARHAQLLLAKRNRRQHRQRLRRRDSRHPHRAQIALVRRSSPNISHLILSKAP